VVNVAGIARDAGVARKPRRRRTTVWMAYALLEFLAETGKGPTFMDHSAPAGFSGEATFFL